ncbi:MAG: hypothetical protein WCY41_00990 [Candidatus Micrarchaeia archaeon]
MPSFKNPKRQVTLEISRLKSDDNNKFLFKQQFIGGQSLRAFRLLGEFARFADPKNEPAPEGMKRAESAFYGHPGFYKNKNRMSLGQKPVAQEFLVQLLNEDMFDVMGDMTRPESCAPALRNFYNMEFKLLVDDIISITTNRN